MKNIFIHLMLLISLSTHISAQTVPISSMALGEIRIGMSTKAIAALLQIQEPPAISEKNGFRADTIQVMYKNIPVTLVLYNTYYHDEPEPKTAIYSIMAAHPALITKSGITLGTDKWEVIQKLDGFILTVQPDWRFESAPDRKKYSVVTLTDGSNGTELTMYFEDNKLTEFRISMFEGC